MKCEACQTEFDGEICPKCGLKITKTRCIDCSKKFNSGYLNHGLCPECLEKEKNMPYKSPLTAFLLSIIPSAGYRYLGLKRRADGFLLLFFPSCLILIGPLFLIPFSAIDSYMIAKRINRSDEYGN